MSKKHLILALFVIFPLVVGLACLGSAPDPTATPVEEEVRVITVVVTEQPTPEPTETPTEEPTPEPDLSSEGLVLLDNSLWIQEEDTVFVAFEVENITNDLVFEEINFSVFVFDAAGNEIGSDFDFTQTIYPEQTYGAVFYLYLGDESLVVDSVIVEWEYNRASQASAADMPFLPEKTLFWHSGGFPRVSGMIRNNTPQTYTDIRANIICYNTAGEIVGGGYTFVDFIPGNDFMGYSTYVDAYDDVASVRVFPDTTYSTKMIEGADFWSDVSIIDDHFYSDDWGNIMGGVIVENETDQVLKNTNVFATFYDDDGHVTTTGYIYIDLLLPNTKIGVSPWVSTPPSDAITSSFDVLVFPGEVLEDYELTSNPFVVNSTEVTGDYEDYVTVSFTNTYDKPVSEVEVYVLLFNAEDLIIGGGDTWTSEPTSAGGTTEVELWVNYDSEMTIARIEAWVVPNNWTRFD